MKQNNWSSGYFKKIFITITVATLSVLIVALVAFQLEFAHATTGYLNAVNSKFLKNAAESITYRIDTIQRDVLTAYSTHYGTVLMAANEPSAVNMVLSLNEIDKKLSTNNNIFSVYFYNSATEKISAFVAHRSYLNYEDFKIITNDDEILPILTNGENLEPFIREMKRPDLSGSTETVITQIFWTPATNGKRNAVVVNLLVDELFAILKSTSTTYSEPQNNFLVYSKTGKILYDGICEQKLASVGTQELLKMANENKTDNFFRKRINGGVFYFNVYNSKDGRAFINIVDKNELATSFSYSPIVFTAILCGACIFAIAMVVIFSRTLYMPIATLTNKLRQSTDEQPHLFRSEIDFIEQSFDNANLKLDRLFEYKERTISISQISFLQDQLLRNTYSANDFWDQCKAKELPYTPGDQFMAIAVVFCGNPTKTESHMLHYAISNVFHELIENICTAHQLPLGDSESLFLCCFKNEQIPDMSDILLNIQTIFSQYFKINISFFMADPVPDPELLCDIVISLQKLSAYQYFYANGCIVHSEQNDFNIRKTELCPLFDFDMFETAVRNGISAEAFTIVNAYFKQLSLYSFESAKASVSLFSAKLIGMLQRIEKQLLTNFELDFHALYTELTTAHRLCDVSALTHEALNLVCSCINDDDDGAMQALAGNIAEYIAANYQDFNLSSKAIAVQHHVSVPTLNRIFKKKSGDSVANYIKKFRLSQSVQLLTDSNLSVETIAENVGFENTKYYYTLFKSEYGMSPSNYRITHSTTKT